jgi:2-O-A-mannosyl-D-glycerate-specific PTS system IIC component
MARNEPDIAALILRTTTREHTLSAMLAHLIEEGLIPFDAASEILAGIARREALGTTAIGQGTALPHLKHACVAHPLLAVALLKTPNDDWESLDAEPVDLVFLILVPYERIPSCKTFFETLMRRLRTGLGDRLRQAPSPQEMMTLVRVAEPGDLS